ncbi:MAG: geranyl transferase [Gammaproteobacteria bacterium]|nr:geranyl transferase [Gammaproteobacteria bacterium]
MMPIRMINSFQIQAILEQILPAATQQPQRLHQAMRYTVLASGKRIRPLLVYATGQSFGAAMDTLNNPAAAVELIHCYSLIHDDLPAMDNDDLRRGQPTCHKQFDEATAILAGDALQCLAFSILAADTHNTAAQTLQMINILGQCCGSFGMAGGQMIDLEAMGKTLTLTDLQTMHALKTGALIKCSVLMGAIAAKVDTATFNNLSDFATHLGLAFQIQDDILDVEGETQLLGKQAGADALLNKPTYPTILGLTAAKQQMEMAYQQALACLDIYGEAAVYLREVAAYLVDRTY